MLSILVILVSVISSISASASSSSEFNASECGIAKMEKDGAYITTVSAEALNAIRIANVSDKSQLCANQRSVSANNTEMNKEVLKVVGYDDEDFIVMGDEEVNYLANNAESMVITDTYYRMDENGNTELVSLEEYNNAQVSLAYSSDNDAETSVEVEEGWFHITTTAVYLDPSTQNGEKGWYVFSGNFEWLSIPNYKMIDAASLGFNVQLEWSNDLTQYFSTRVDKYKYHGLVELGIGEETTYTSLDTTNTSRKEYTDLHLYSDGLYCEWQLPSDIVGSDYSVLYELTGCEIYLRGKARIGLYNSEQGFTVFSRYEHTYSAVSWQPSFSWDESILGVVAESFALVNGSNTYSSHCGVVYDPTASSERG